MLGLSEKEWLELGAEHTSKEIWQQPRLWEEVVENLEKEKGKIESFLIDKMEKENLRVIFTGAGTSAYVGEIIVPYLNKSCRINKFEAIATTDIVDNPELYFKKNIPTILVSFARSGNSPESVATYNLANELIDDVNHVFITCNPEGELAKISKENKEKTLLILMPEDSNDKGLAMTGSFSTMTLAGGIIFDDDIGRAIGEAKKAIIIGKDIVENKYKKLDDILENDFNRVVYLGSGSFKGLAKESALKLLELTRGNVTSMIETPLGFRHGPKAFIDDKTLIFIYMSEDDYKKKYDMDLLNEVYLNEGDHKVIALSQVYDEDIKTRSHYHISIMDEILENDIMVSLLFALFAQTMALKTSIKCKIEPDNPNPSGLIHRVVQGVVIYPYE